MPAGHDGAPFPLEQCERARTVDHLLEDEPPATGDGGEGAEHEAAAPEERQMPPPRVVGTDTEPPGNTPRRCRERAVGVHHGLRLGGGARGEEHGRHVGRRHGALDRVEKRVVDGRGQVAPARASRRLSLDQDDAT